MKITISGMPGAGKTTVSEILADKLNLDLVNIGNLRRKAAEEKNMSLEEFNNWSKNNPDEGDIYFDNYQKRYGKEKDNFVMESRLGAYFIPDSVKIYLDVDINIAAERIWNNKRKVEDYSNIEKLKKSLKERVINDKERYMSIYSFDPYNKDNYDIVLDTIGLSANQVAERIEKRLKDF